MLPIEQALHDLHAVTKHLESAVRKQEMKAEERAVLAQQQELFDEEAAHHEFMKLDPAIIVRHLDSTIAKVESLLKEG